MSEFDKDLLKIPYDPNPELSDRGLVEEKKEAKIKGIRKLRKEVSAKEIVSNALEYKNSEARQKAIDDVIKAWFKVNPEIKVAEKIFKAFKDPDNYIASVEKAIDRLPAGEMRAILEEDLEGFTKLHSSVKETYEAWLNNRLGYKDTYDVDLDKDLKD